MSSIDLLSDDVVAHLGRWATVVEYAKLQRVSKRIHHVLSAHDVVKDLCRERGAPDTVNNLHELAFFVDMQKSGLLEENRLGFCLGSPDADPDETDGKIKGSATRIRTVRRLMSKFPTSKVIIQAHCGTLAPGPVSVPFSRARAICVCHALCDELQDPRIEINSWGKRIAQIVSKSAGAYGDVAREGKGWVEIYIQMNDTTLPALPACYDGLLAV